MQLHFYRQVCLIITIMVLGLTSINAQVRPGGPPGKSSVDQDPGKFDNHDSTIQSGKAREDYVDDRYPNLALLEKQIILDMKGLTLKCFPSLQLNDLFDLQPIYAMTFMERVAAYFSKKRREEFRCINALGDTPLNEPVSESCLDIKDKEIASRIELFINDNQSKDFLREKYQERSSEIDELFILLYKISHDEV